MEHERPEGVVVQLGGQTPLRLARPLAELGVPIMGTSVDAIDEAEDRRRFEALCRRLEIRTPEAGTATSVDEALGVAGGGGHPPLVRPGYLLRGGGLQNVDDQGAPRGDLGLGVLPSPGHPLPLERFPEGAL